MRQKPCFLRYLGCIRIHWPWPLSFRSLMSANTAHLVVEDHILTETWTFLYQKKPFRICNRTFSCSVVWSHINISSSSLIIIIIIVIIKARFYREINHPQDSSSALRFITSFGDEIPKLKLHFPRRVGWHECASIESAGVERKQSIVRKLVWWIP